MPSIRRAAVNVVRRDGWSIRKSARHYGVQPSTVMRWIRRAPSHRGRVIPTLSSRPLHSPRALPSDIVDRILDLRKERDQCAQILHHRLMTEGTAVSLSSVTRTLRRHHLTYPSKWKKWHQYPPRPVPESPGILVQIDSMQEGLPQEHLYAYALIDVCSRWGWALPVFRTTSWQSAWFIQQAEEYTPFSISTIQSDHGKEFSKWFTTQLHCRGIAHHHSRVRTPTDNTYVERFIQTLQRECLSRIPRSLRSWRKELPDYLRYYNTERPHMGLKMKTPTEVLRSY